MFELGKAKLLLSRRIDRHGSAEALLAPVLQLLLVRASEKFDRVQETRHRVLLGDTDPLRLEQNHEAARKP